MHKSVGGCSWDYTGSWGIRLVFLRAVEARNIGHRRARAKRMKFLRGRSLQAMAGRPGQGSGWELRMAVHGRPALIRSSESIGPTPSTAMRHFDSYPTHGWLMSVIAIMPRVSDSEGGHFSAARLQELLKSSLASSCGGTPGASRENVFTT